MRFDKKRPSKGKRSGKTAMSADDKALFEQYVAGIRKALAAAQKDATRKPTKGHEKSHARFAAMAIEGERAALARALANPAETVNRIREEQSSIDAAFSEWGS